VVYRSLEELSELVAAVLSAAASRGDVVWASVTDLLRATIQKRLPDLTSGIVFGEPTQLYGYSGQTIAVRRADHVCEIVKTGRGATILSDSAALSSHPAAREWGSDHWSVVEASCNAALAGLPVTLMCLFHVDDVDGAAEDAVYWNHPEVVVGAAAGPNSRYRRPERVLEATPVPPAPSLGPPDQVLAFADGSVLPAIRASTRRHGEAARLAPSRVDGLVVAVGELVSNSIEHGAGHGTLSWWTTPGRAVAEIHDPGPMGAVTPGLRRPDALAPRGRGVWLARQFSDVLHLWTTSDGTHARLEITA
jgi:anti-sigma regulatory factor (Ser/Thr protein kinase)